MQGTNARNWNLLSVPRPTTEAGSHSQIERPTEARHNSALTTAGANDQNSQPPSEIDWHAAGKGKHRHGGNPNAQPGASNRGRAVPSKLKMLCIKATSPNQPITYYYIMQPA